MNKEQAKQKIKTKVIRSDLDHTRVNQGISHYEFKLKLLNRIKKHKIELEEKSVKNVQN